MDICFIYETNNFNLKSSFFIQISIYLQTRNVYFSHNKLNFQVVVVFESPLCVIIEMNIKSRMIHNLALNLVDDFYWVNLAA